MTKLNLEELIQSLKAERVRRKIPFETIAKRGGWPNESNVRRLEKPDANPTLRSIQRYALAIGVELKVTVEAMRVLRVGLPAHPSLFAQDSISQ